MTVQQPGNIVANCDTRRRPIKQLSFHYRKSTFTALLLIISIMCCRFINCRLNTCVLCSSKSVKKRYLFVKKGILLSFFKVRIR